MTIARRVRVTGRVQGVFFRAWAQEQARELGVSGWIGNRGDGSVGAHLEGPEGAVGELIQRLNRGPPAAHVDDVQVSEAELRDLKNFDVRR